MINSQANTKLFFMGHLVVKHIIGKEVKFLNFSPRHIIELMQLTRLC